MGLGSRNRAGRRSPNLKIAWNLTVCRRSRQSELRGFLQENADLMPHKGMDKQRGGW